MQLKHNVGTPRLASVYATGQILKKICKIGRQAWRPYKRFSVLLALFFTACTTRLPELVFPNHLNFQGKTYQKVTDNRLDEMRQSLYLASDSEKNPEDWQQGFLLFSDQNSAGQTLEQRVAFRKETAVNLPETYVAYQVEQNELRSQAIYLPTERFKNVQLEVTRGRNLACGYGQMQFAQKKYKIAKSCENSTRCYQAELQNLMNKFNQLAWQMECR